MAALSARRGALLGLLGGALLGGGAAVGWHAWSNRAPAAASAEEAALSQELAAAGVSPRQRAAFESLVRAYILDHPEVLPEAVERLKQREAQAAIEPLRGTLEKPFDGAVLGNPRGRKVLVEFADYACGFCRRAEADVEAMVKADPELKVVIRLLPVIGPQSEPAARMGLAAARQGRYAAFHQAIYAGPAPSDAAITAAAGTAGLDLSAARRAGAEQAVTDELQQNLALARRLGISGTPAWVAGNQLLSGAIGRERLEAALAGKPAAG